jgi:hypothetical protein
MNRQWLDFRNHDRATLRRMAEELRPDTPEQLVRQLVVNVTPLDFRQQVIPASISLLNLAIFFVGVTIAAFIGAGPIPTLNFNALTAKDILGIIIGTLITIGIYLIVIRGSLALLRREVGYRGCAALFLIPIAIIAGLTAVIFFPLVVIPVGLIYLVFTSLRQWLPAGGYTGERRRVDVQTWWRNIFTYGMMIFLVFGLLGRRHFFGEPELPPEKIVYARVSPVPNLSMELPTHWLQRPIADDAALHQFGVDTLDDNSFTEFGNLAAELENVEESQMVRLLRHDMTWDALGDRSTLAWVALYEPIGVSEHVLVSVWQVAKTTNAASLLEAKKQKFTLASDHYTILDEIPVSESSTCLHMKVNDPDTGIAEEWYCGVGTQDMIDIKVSKDLINVQQPVVAKILASLSVQGQQLSF